MSDRRVKKYSLSFDLVLPDIHMDVKIIRSNKCCDNCCDSAQRMSKKVNS